ncbi:hypothetical protein N826_21080 [Skermanella aerolata KACC 11604]|nr:hypothetical protein N826_21080 [Skermanella aerolata KACC 11604]
MAPVRIVPLPIDRPRSGFFQVRPTLPSRPPDYQSEERRTF